MTFIVLWFCSKINMVNELLEGIHFVASMEALSLGSKAGIHPLIVHDIISNAAGNSWYTILLDTQFCLKIILLSTSVAFDAPNSKWTDDEYIQKLLNNYIEVIGEVILLCMQGFQESGSPIVKRYYKKAIPEYLCSKIGKRPY